MSVAMKPRMEQSDIDEQLDQLIPPTPSIFKRFAWGISIAAAAVVVSILVISGRVFPNPIAGAGWSSGAAPVAQIDEQILTAVVDMPNLSSRDIRITDISLDAPGVEMVGVGIQIEPRLDGPDANGNQSVTIEEMTEIIVDENRNDWTGEPNLPLPVTLEPDRWANIYVQFRISDCTNPLDPDGDWGIATATVDFGEGAFPPVSRSIALPDPLVEAHDEDITFRVFDSRDDFTVEFVTFDGMLTGACEVFR